MARSSLVILVILASFARLAAAQPPSRGYAAVVGTIIFDGGADSAAGFEAGYRLGTRPLLLHALIADGDFGPVSGGFGTATGASGRYVEARAGIETDACPRAWYCLVFGADLGYEHEHAANESASPDFTHAVVVVGRGGLELHSRQVRLGLVVDLRAGLAVESGTTSTTTGKGATASLGLRF